MEAQAIALPTLHSPKPTTEVNRWKPHPGPQEFALAQPDNTFETLYGGARGGGKTDAGMVFMAEPIDNPKYRGLVIRRNADDLSDWVDRARFMYKGFGVRIAYRPAILSFPGGAIIRTGHLKDENAYTKYQGHEYHRVLIEELTQIPNEKAYLQLISSCRSTVPGLVPQIFNTTNPGNIGHAWVRERFVDQAPPMHRFPDPITGRLRIFVPARIDDNPTLMKVDPGYVATLEGLQKVDQELYKAWRLGLWDVFAGQVFREWNYDKHTFEAMPWSLDACRRYITFDWGYNDPGVAHWIALTPKNAFGVRRAYIYRELRMVQKNPEEWANAIKAITDIEQVHGMVLPHDCFAHKHSHETIADIFGRITKVPIERGDTLSKGARLNRVAIMHRYLQTAADGLPYLQIHRSCVSAIKTIPNLPYDDKNVEDVNTKADDHDYDSISMGLVHMGFVPENSAIIGGSVERTTQHPTWYSGQDGSIHPGNFWEKMAEQKASGDPSNWEYN